MKRVPGTFAVSGRGGGLAARRKYCLMSNVPETLALHHHIGLIKGRRLQAPDPDITFLSSSIELELYKKTVPSLEHPLKSTSCLLKGSQLRGGK